MIKVGYAPKNESIMNESDVDFLFNARSKKVVKTHIYDRNDLGYSGIVDAARKLGIKVEPMFRMQDNKDYWLTGKISNLDDLFKLMVKINPNLKGYNLQDIYNDQLPSYLQ